MGLNIQRQISFSNICQAFLANLIFQVGTFIFSVTMIFVWFMLPKIDLSYINFQLETVETRGKISKIVEILSPHSMDRNNYIYQYFYSFKDDEGAKVESYSYANKKRKKFRVGKNPIIEYPKDKIELSRVKGMRRKSQPTVAIIILAFPLLGLFFIVFGFKQSLNKLKLLKSGILTKAYFSSKQSTNSEINQQKVYKFIFEFKDQSNRNHTASEESHLFNFSENEEKEVLYLQENPSNALLLNLSPTSLSINNQGDISPSPMSIYWLLTTLPIFAHGLYFIFWIST